MSGLTLEQYRKMKKEGRVEWDSGALNQHVQRVNNYLSSAGDKEYSASKKEAAGESAAFLRAYANSRKGAADYNDLQDLIGNVERGVSSVNDYYGQKKAASYSYKGDMNVPTAEQSQKNKLIAQYENALKKYYETQGETNSTARVLGSGTPVGNYAAANALMEVEKNPIIQEYKREKQLKDTATTDTVPTKEQAEQYRADAAALRKTGYESKYGEFDYDKLIQAAQGEQNPEKKQWLRNKADERASSAQLQGELDELTKRKGELDTEKSGLLAQLERASSVAEKQRISGLIAEIDQKHDSETAREYELNELLPKKAQEEKDNKLSEQLEKDPEALDIAKKYWYWQNYKGIASGDGHMTGREARTMEYIKNAEPGEFEKIEEKFNALSEKGYDVHELKNYISKVMTAEDNETEYGELKEQAKNAPVLASVRSVGENILGAIPDALKYLASAAQDEYIDPKDTNVGKAQARREAVSEDMNGLGKFLYQTGMSMADFLSTAALSAVPGGQAVGMTMLSTSAGVSAANEVIENGGDVGHAISTGIAAGIAEAVFERVSLEQLKAFKAEKPDSVKAIVKNTLKGMFTEGSEEFFTDIANAISDGIINGDMSSLSLRQKNYIDQGMSTDEAWKKTAADFAAQLGESFAGGALSGGIMGGGVSTLSYADQKTADTRLARKIGKEAQKSEGFDVEQLLEDAENSGSEKAASIAKYVRKDIESGKKPKKTDIGNIYQAISEYRRQENGGLEAEKKELVNDYSDSGTEKLSTPETESEGENKPKSYAFGKTFAKGLPITTISGEHLGVARIESSAADYGQSDRTVVLKTNDGKFINADDVEATQPFFKTLFNRAKNYDTMGARGLVSQFAYYQEHMKETGGEVNVDKYHRAFERLYELGKSGVKWDNVVNNKYYSREIDYLGTTAASGAVVTGNNDVNVNLMHEQNKAQRIRIPGMRTSAESKLIVDPDNQTEIKASDEQLELLNAVATKIGRNIVLTDRFDENGMYMDNVVYVNSQVDERYMTSIALHEATHGIRETSPAEYKDLQEFVSNYLVEKGESLETMIDDIEARWGDRAASYESKLEEVVCQTVMAIATDENALKTALDAPGNSSLLENVAAAIKKLAQRVMDFVKGQRNRQAQPWLGDVKALNELAEKFSAAADADKASRYKQETNQSEQTEQEVETEKEQKNNAAKGVKHSVDDTLTLSNVNKIINSKIETAQFKKWFGDWQNSPKNASKIVDSKGEPMIVYHQTGNDFTVFDTNKQGAGEFDDETPNGIFLKPFPNDIGLSGQKQMALYANIRNPVHVNSREGLIKFYNENIDGYQSAKSQLGKIDDEYSKAFKEEEKRENQEYQKLWEAWQRGEISREEYKKQASRDNLEKILEHWEAEGNEARKNIKSLINDFFSKSDYDGIIINNDTGSFGRSTKTFIALKPEQVKSATENIGLFDENNPDIRYAIDDTLTDGFFDIGEDLFETDRSGELENLLKLNPEAAVSAIYNSAAKTAQRVLSESRSVKISDAEYQKLARRVLKKYDVNWKLNPGIDKEFADKVKSFVEESTRGSDFYASLDLLGQECKDMILLSGHYDEDTLKDVRENVLGFVSNKTLLVTEYQAEQIRENYGSLSKYRSRIGKMRVAMEQNAKNGGVYIEELIANIGEQYPELVATEPDSLSGFEWLDNLLNNVIAPHYVNEYADGIRESVSEAAIEMTFDITTEIAGAKAWAIARDNKAKQSKIKELTGEKKIADTQREALLRAKAQKNARRAMNLRKYNMERVRKFKKEIADTKRKGNEKLENQKKKYEEEIGKLNKQIAELQNERSELRGAMIADNNKKVESLKAKISALEDERSELRGAMIADNNKKVKSLKAKISALEDERSDLKGIILSDNRTFRQNYIEERDKSNSIRQLGKMLNSMTKKLDGKTNNSAYIPDNIKKPMLKVLKLFRVEKQKKDGTTKALPAYFGEFRNLDDVGGTVYELAAEYERLKPTVEKNDGADLTSGHYRDFVLGYSEALSENLTTLAAALSGKNVYDLTAAELRDVLTCMRDIRDGINYAGEIIVNGKKSRLEYIAKKCVGEMEKVHFNKKDENAVKAALKDAGSSVLATSLDPVRYGRFLSGYNDDSIIAKLFTDLHAGDKKRVKILREAFLKMEEVQARYSNKELRAMQRDDVKEFDFKDLDTGERVKISRGMLISIALTSYQKLGMKHLVERGAKYDKDGNLTPTRYTRIPDLDLMNKNENLPDFKGNHKKAAGEKSHKIRLDDNSVAEIVRFVENDELCNDFAKTIKEVFNGFLKDEINKVSMQKYGKLIATVNNYFPLRVDPYDAVGKFDAHLENDLVFRDNRLKSVSFIKQRDPRANAAIIIEDAFRVFTNHVNKVAEYCGTEIPIENITKVYNSGGRTLVGDIIRNKFGEEAVHYISKLLGDMQNRKDYSDVTWIDKLSGQIMGSVLMVNPGAALKNVAAFPLAYKYFGANNVNTAAIKGIVEHKKMNELIDKYGEYTPYMWYREQGNGTVVGELSKQAGLYSKWTDKFDLMGKMDRYVVNSLLFAAEQHVKQTTNLKVDSEEFCQEVARQFEKAVDESQPNNMITSKPQFIRNNTLRLLSMNAFKSQNLAMGNGILDSFMEFKTRTAEYKANATEEAKAAKNAAAKKFVSHLLGVAASSMIYSALGIASTILIYHRPDDYKDEKGNISVEEILKKWGLGSVESFLGAFVGLEEIYSTISTLIDGNSYYSNNMGNMALSGVSELAKYCKNGNYSKAWGKIADLLGIPLAFGTNVQRLLDSASRYANDIAHGRAFITNNKGEIDTSGFAYAIVSSVESGDMANAEWIERTWTEKLKGSGKNGEEANKYIKGKIAETLALKDEDVEKAALAKQNGDYAEYERLLNAVAGKGFDPADVKKAVEKVMNNVVKDLKERGLSKEGAKEDLQEQGFSEKGADALIGENFEDEEAEEEETEYSAFSDTTDGGVAYDMNDAFDALVSGDKAGYEQISNYLVNEGGVEEKKLSSSMRSATRTDELWKQYYTALYAHDEQTRIELKKTLETIYGSWQAAAKKGEAYWKRKGNKEVKH